MATAEQIAELRAMINQLEDVEPYTDVYLSGRIDAAENLRSLAGAIWREKAATYADLVDVQEGSSRRALGSLYSNALRMATSFDGDNGSDTDVGALRPARTRQIERA